MNEEFSEQECNDGMDVTVQMDLSEIMNPNAGDIVGYKLVESNGPDYQLEDGINSIGRLKRANTIHIRDQFCSALHAEIYLEDNILELVDQGSTNGTFVNGVRLAPGTRQILEPGDKIGVGHTLLTVEAIRNGNS